MTDFMFGNVHVKAAVIRGNILWRWEGYFNSHSNDSLNYQTTVEKNSSTLPVANMLACDSTVLILKLLPCFYFLFVFLLYNPPVVVRCPWILAGRILKPPKMDVFVETTITFINMQYVFKRTKVLVSAKKVAIDSALKNCVSKKKNGGWHRIFPPKLCRNGT